jgi:hypothetical protein
MTVQVTMTVVETSQDEDPAPKVTNYLVEFPNIDLFLDMLSYVPEASADCVVLKLTGEEIFSKA